MKLDLSSQLKIKSAPHPFYYESGIAFLNIV
jgi:hypothetical protein